MDAKELDRLKVRIGRRHVGERGVRECSCPCECRAGKEECADGGVEEDIFNERMGKGNECHLEQIFLDRGVGEHGDDVCH
jgi:hypothetical protein